MSDLELWCVRHGETEFNKENRIQGCMDTELSDHGRRQIVHVGNRLKSVQFDAVYSSDLKRAHETARAINQHHDHEVQLDQRLRERHFGVFQGLTQNEITEQMPDLSVYFETRDPAFQIPDGQSRFQKLEQVQAFMHDMKERHAGERILTVTHGGVVYSMIHHVLGIPLDRDIPGDCTNTSITVFQFESQRWVLNRWGDSEHLK